MNRIRSRFDALKAAERSALVSYVTAGDPHPDVTVSLMHRMVDAGVDILELGVPFSDPIGDGPVIQLACERALAHGTRLRDVIGMVARFRERDQTTPVVLMGYLNPIELMGHQAFAREAGAAGVDGVLTVDLPPEEMDDLSSALADASLAPIFLVAPTTTDARMERICSVADGFVYYVSLKGVTGSAALDSAGLVDRIQTLKRMTGLPVGVGFGIGTPEQAAEVSRIADAVVVGSALVRRIEQHVDDPEAAIGSVVELLAAMRAAMDDAATAAA